MAMSAFNAPWSVVKNYTLAREPLRSLINTVSFTTSAHGAVFEGLDILANSVSIVLNHRTIFRDCRIRFLMNAAVVGNAASDGSEFNNCQIEYMVTPTPLNSLNAGWVAMSFTNADHVRIRNMSIKGSTAAVVLSGCTDFGADQLRAENLLNTADGSRGNFLRATNCPGLELGNFACINDLSNSYTGDLIWLSNCDGAHIYNGILDGNNAPTGAGIRLINSDTCLLENIDAIRMSDSAVDIDSGNHNHLFNVRTRSNNGVGTGGRAAPTGGGWAFRNAGLHTTYEQCVTYELATPSNILDNTGSVQHQDIQNKVFTVGVE